jgi:hypothetical protein
VEGVDAGWRYRPSTACESCLANTNVAQSIGETLETLLGGMVSGLPTSGAEHIGVVIRDKSLDEQPPIIGWR